MAAINDIKYFTEWQKGAVQYRLECILAGDTVLTTPQEIEFPASSFLVTRKCNGGYENNEPIGCPTAHEEIFEIDLAGFPGSFVDAELVTHSWTDVADLIVQRGIPVATGELAFNYYTNRWILKKRLVGSTFSVIFDGFQVPTGDARKITGHYGTNGFKSSLEIKAQDCLRTLLADVNIDKTMMSPEGVVFPRQYVPILSSNLIPTGNSDMFIHTLLSVPNLNLEALSDDDDTFKSAFVPENYVIVSYNSIFLALNYRIAYVAYKKYRRTVPASAYLYQSIFTNEFYSGNTFYKINHTYLSSTTKGDPLAISDLMLLYEINSWAGDADKHTQTLETTWNVFENGNLAYDNAFDMISEWAIVTANKIKLHNVTDSTVPVFEILKINESYNNENLTITTDKVAGNPEWTELRDNITAAVYHYSDIDNSNTSEFKLNTPGTLSRQPSYEIDSAIDTMYSNINPDLTVNAEKMYITFLGTTSIYYRFEIGIFYDCGSKFSNLFYIETINQGVAGQTQIAINPANVITYNFVDYGEALPYPQYLPYGTSGNPYYFNPYYVNQAIQNYINQIQANPAYPALWTKLIEEVFGVSAKVWTVQIEVGGEFFDPTMIGAQVDMNFYSFVNSSIDINIPSGGYITSIEDYDIDKDTYKINILLTTGR